MNASRKFGHGATLLLCGPQSHFPPSSVISRLHQALLLHQIPLKLLPVVQDLQTLFQQLIHSEPQAARLSYSSSLDILGHWLESGQLRVEPEDLPNHASFPFIVLLEVAMYLHHVDSKEASPLHDFPLGDFKKYGVQGFCAGFLAAAAIAFSANDEEIARMSAVSIRLAMCIGTYIDVDTELAELPNLAGSLSAQWRQGEVCLTDVNEMLSAIPQTYISCITDECCVTITTEASSLVVLETLLKTRGIMTRAVNISGRFHRRSEYNTYAAKRIENFCISAGLAYPSCSDLRMPLRCNSGVYLMGKDGKLEHWYGTIQNALGNSDPEAVQAVSLALVGNILPTALSTKFVCHHSVAWSLASSSPNELGRFTRGYPPHSVAVVGMACRLPGADSVDQFWELLLSGASMVRELPKDRLNFNGERWENKSKFWGNFVNDVDAFDHKFFNKSPREAASWDPQKRILLEVIYQALECTGHFGPSIQGATTAVDYGCYIGVACNSYYDNVACHPPTAYSLLGTSRAFSSGHISHQLGLTGPAISIDTACSSSLVAVHLACKAIQAGECSGAIAGGTNIFTSPYDYQNLAAAGFLSPTGACKSFDASADGYCRGEGVAAVVLKPLSKAVTDGDHIWGVITGSGVNQNFNDTHVTVPCAKSQSQLYKRVIKSSGMLASEVTYVEAHGTGTQVGDPVELQSIRDVFGGSSRRTKLHIGAVKAQVGHAEAAAGVSGLIKTLLMMNRRVIIGQATLGSLNLKIPPLHPDMMDISKTCQPWTSSTPSAFVNSYGAAGSNAAVAVRDASPLYPAKRPGLAENTPDLAKQPLFLAAASQKSLAAFSQRVADSLKASKEKSTAHFTNLLFALADRGNHTLACSISKTVLDIADLERTLLDVATGRIGPVKDAFRRSRPVVLAFGRQELDHVGLPQQAFEHIHILRSHLDHCNVLAMRYGAGCLFPAIFEPTSITSRPLLHAALFATQYSTAMCWLDCGIVPAAVVGHSFGQFAALCISGCISLAAAIKLVVGRAKLIESSWGSEPGTMLSVQADSETLSKVLASLNRPTLEIACYNHPTSNVVVGSDADVAALESYLVDHEELQHTARTKRLNVTNGFHSVFTESLLPALRDIANGIEWKRPSIHIDLCTQDEQADPPGAWLAAEHTRKPVYFRHAVDRLSARLGSCTWLEAGRKTSVTSLVRKCLTTSSGDHTYHASALSSSDRDPMGTLAELTVDLWNAGIQFQHWTYHRSQKHEFGYVSLHPYQFEKTRHWIPFVDRTSKPEGPARVTAAAAQPGDAHPFISFLGFQDDEKQEASFLVDGQSERYTMLAAGHRIYGKILAPVSLNLELPSCAALRLSDGVSYKTHVTSIESLEMTSPVTLDPERDILLLMKRVARNGLTWCFFISSQAKRSGSENTTHLSGKVSLIQRGEPVLDETMSRWGALISYERCLSILHSADAERMQGKHIYHALKPFFDFDSMYQGIKSISNIGKEVVGVVVAKPGRMSIPGEDLYDSPVILSLMQFSPILVNYFCFPSEDAVRVCLRIGRIVTGSAFDIHAGEWLAYALVTKETEKYAVVDVYVFDRRTKELVIVFLGSHFSRIPVSTWLKRIQDASTAKSHAPGAQVPRLITTPTLQADNHDRIPPPPTQAASHHNGRDLFKLLHQVTGIPLDEFQDDKSLDDIGVDSLMMTEVLNDLSTVFSLDMEMEKILSFPTLGALAQYVGSTQGVVAQPVQHGLQSLQQDTPNAKNGAQSVFEAPSDPGLIDYQSVFKECKNGYDRFARQIKGTGFWSGVYPLQSELVVTYVVEAFASLGCDILSLDCGQLAPVVTHQPNHDKIVRQLFRVLEDAGMVSTTEEGNCIRSESPVKKRSAATLLGDLLARYPQHVSVHKLLEATGTELAPLLTGQKDARSDIFANKVIKKYLADLYENWPLLRAAKMVLADFLERAFSSSDPAGRTFRILEVGAATAGTSKFLVEYLEQHGVFFEYVFTDVSPSLVAEARRNIFPGKSNMEFRVFNIGHDPPSEWLGTFDVVLSSNYIHATANLTDSLKMLRCLLRGGGVLALVECTRNMFWLDLVFGFFEGWWSQSDGREHAIAGAEHWEFCMLEAGFRNVSWSEGEEPEADTVRVIAGFT